jgi:hypothetical protein
MMPNLPKTIKGKVNIQGFDSDIVIDEVNELYDAYEKDFPDNLPQFFTNGEPITWFSNFGVKKKVNNENEKAVPRYRVIMNNLPSGKRLCIYDDTLPEGEKLQEVTPENGDGAIKYKETGNDKIMFHLYIGDPPSGVFP